MAKPGNKAESRYKNSLDFTLRSSSREHGVKTKKLLTKARRRALKRELNGRIED